ncbi:hypothetical protein AMAG_08929 [Allomyces macrogynus ATCC 38327]|uniref:Uncharacterized protein n=1 Tax=Allomyces macrogynus (strain ATCC 38327) TaxID=578462 RepID=A0A0L0SNA3_ALLM3|nr:hypothetical protein AMAG_08929 [Allomyces macrogynus ATCC 38327]|eukprot:KNE63864.1 hypothetical protein AMAG_08929 [Allomyces macrogynus ATCC 38327]
MSMHHGVSMISVPSSPVLASHDPSAMGLLAAVAARHAPAAAAAAAAGSVTPAYALVPVNGSASASTTPLLVATTSAGSSGYALAAYPAPSAGNAPTMHAVGTGTQPGTPVNAWYAPSPPATSGDADLQPRYPLHSVTLLPSGAAVGMTPAPGVGPASFGAGNAEVDAVNDLVELAGGTGAPIVLPLTAISPYPGAVLSASERAALASPFACAVLSASERAALVSPFAGAVLTTSERGVVGGAGGYGSPYAAAMQTAAERAIAVVAAGSPYAGAILSASEAGTSSTPSTFAVTTLKPADPAPRPPYLSATARMSSPAVRPTDD